MFSGVVLSVEFIYGLKKWFGKKLPNIPRKEKTVLSLSHTFLSFMFVAVSFFVSFIVFVFECVYKKYATKSLKK